MTTFEKLREHRIPTLQATVEEYVEPASGARHIHLSTGQEDMAFLVAFPTVPDSSDGRAHILEHLALCGSERYPVRDPFFAMMRRSTASFMNAFTYADRTVYPFASTDRNDFFNLLDVYLDSAFFPRLDYLNFLQEGWRHTLTNGKLGYQGVVFNEMKGALADPISILHGGITEALLAGTTYAVISGGDPLAIPDLTHEQLKQFHASHYHPSQAVFMSAGPIAARDIQEQIAQRVLARLSGRSEPLMPQLAVVEAARQVRIRVPSQAARPDEFGVQLAWLMGESSDPDVYYHASLLQAGLLGDASAPLKKLMESAGYGRPAPLNGMDPSARQLIFHVGMEGLTEPQAAEMQERILATLERTAQDGVPVETLRAALRDIRYEQRDTSINRMPNILGRMLGALPVAMWGGDVAGAFDSEAVLNRLESDIGTPAFFQKLVRDMLDSPARLDAIVVPDQAFFSARDVIERARLDAVAATLDDNARKRIDEQSAELDMHQRRPSDTQMLPRIRPTDVSPHPRTLPAVPESTEGKHVFSIASNGLSYARIEFDVSAFAESERGWLHLYAVLRRDLGVADDDYAQSDVWRSGMVPSFAVSLEAVQDIGGALHPRLVFSTSALHEEHANMAAVLRTYITQPRFDEHERIAFLVQRLVRDRLQGLGQDGNRLAAIAAAAPLSPLRRFENDIDGVAALPFLGELARFAGSASGVAYIASTMTALHARILASPAKLLCAGSTNIEELAGLIELPTAAQAQAPLPGAQQTAATPANQALHAPGQVNHCSISWAVPQQDHPQAPALAVAAELLTNQVLHSALRERGGAYGGSASYAGNLGVFSMASYRDPRLAGTYADFSAAIDTLLDMPLNVEQVEEAIICVIKQLDRPVSPFDTVLAAWRLRRRGVDEHMLRRFRNGVLACTLDDVKSAVGTWLKRGQPSRAAFAGDATQDLAGLELVNLLALSGTSQDDLASSSPVQH